MDQIVRRVRRTPAVDRRTLLRYLRTDSGRRALAIARLYEDTRTTGLAELLIDLETDDLFREELITFLEAAEP